MTILHSVIAVVAAYLLGSIPSAYIAGRLVKGIDIRKVGGGNVGAVNALREVGTAAGFAVFFADIAKGALAVLIARWLGLPQIAVFVTGFAAVAGHNWPIFLQFKGGKGGATTAGVFFALVPVEFAIAFTIMFAIGLVTSNARFSFGIGFLLLPFIIWGFGGELSLILYSIALPVFISLCLIPDLRKRLASPKAGKNLIIDRDHTWWQKRRKP